MPSALAEFHQLMIEEGAAFEKMLGRMVINWSEIEYTIYRVLLHYSRVSDPIGRSIFSGMQRAQPMMAAITALLENTNASDARRQDWTYISSQISSIQTMRDLLTHHVSHSFGFTDYSALQNFLGWPFHRALSDIARKKRRHEANIYKVDSALIGHMCRDMRVIALMLDRHTAKGRFKPMERPDPAWLYKFPQPEIGPKQTRAKTPKRQRPPKPSRGK